MHARVLVHAQLCPVSAVSPPSPSPVPGPWGLLPLQG